MISMIYLMPSLRATSYSVLYMYCNPLMTGITLYCSWRFESVIVITLHVHALLRKIFLENR